MPIDASIYQNLKPAQMPDIMDTAQKSANLTALAMQNTSMARSLAEQQAAKAAYANNVDSSGQLNRQGFLSDLAKVSPTSAMTYQKQFNEMDKNQADVQSQKMDNIKKTVSAVMPSMEYLAGLPEDQRAQEYPKVMQQLGQQGVPMQNVPAQYDPGVFRQAYTTLTNTKNYLDDQLTRSEIAKNSREPLLKQAEITNKEQQLGSSELNNFKDDIVNASSRKTTGGLLDSINRADRMIALSNAGAKPGETDQQRIERLNQFMPQIEKEFEVSLASMLQGGVPQETLIKEVGVNNIQKDIADLKQKFTANPTAANQGAIIEEYVNAAKKLRDFSQGRVQDMAQRIRAAYPYANKYYSDQMDKIATPLVSPQAGGSSSPIDADVQQYADKHGISVMQAQAIKDSRIGKSQVAQGGM